MLELVQAIKMERESPWYKLLCVPMVSFGFLILQPDLCKATDKKT